MIWLHLQFFQHLLADEQNTIPAEERQEQPMEPEYHPSAGQGVYDQIYSEMDTDDMEEVRRKICYLEGGRGGPGFFVDLHAVILLSPLVSCLGSGGGIAKRTLTLFSMTEYDCVLKCCQVALSGLTYS